MKYICLLLTSLMLISTSAAMAEETRVQQKFVETPVEPQPFVEKASAAGLTEVELAKMALQKSTQDEVRHFAQMMIEGHTLMNKELRALANNEGLNIADEPTLMKQAKTFMLAQKKGESFDEAYAKHQVESHEQTYTLFRQAAKSSNDNVRKFAEAKLPSLEHHLNMARALVTTVAQASSVESGTPKETPKGIFTP